MAAVMVFVDDALTGRLPAVCATTGKASDEWRTVEAGVRRSRPTEWMMAIGLVMLAIPLFWHLLVIYLAVLGGFWLATALAGEETLTVQIPTTEDTHQRVAATVEQQWAARGMAAAGLLGGIGSFLLTNRYLVSALLVGAGIIAAVWAYQRNRQKRILASLDASRRWVRLDGVHPDFVAAVLADDETSSRPA